MKYTTLFFDLDETLYPTGSGLWQIITDRISSYMIERMGLDPVIVPELRVRLYQTYGTTFGGLRREYQIDDHDFLDYVHDLPLTDHLHPDPELHQMLQAYPQEKWVFTNADAGHARRIMEVLNIADCFKGIIDILDIDPHSKPHPNAYHTALQLAAVDDPTTCVFMDDRHPNLDSARKLGFFTIQVGSHPQGEIAHPRIPVITDLPDILPLNSA
jgi:pyrimidine 5'-nucleotidase